MSIEKAIKKISTKININSIADAVELNGNYVFISDDIIQPIYVTNDNIRCLNSNLTTDREIVNAAYAKIEEGKTI